MCFQLGTPSKNGEKAAHTRRPPSRQLSISHPNTLVELKQGKTDQINRENAKLARRECFSAKREMEVVVVVAAAAR